MYIILFLFWLLLNGRLTWEIVFLGLAIVALMAVLEWKLFGYTPARELRLAQKAPILCAYVPVHENLEPPQILLEPALRVFHRALRIAGVLEFRVKFGNDVLGYGGEFLLQIRPRQIEVVDHFLLFVRLNVVVRDSARSRGDVLVERSDVSLDVGKLLLLFVDRSLRLAQFFAEVIDPRLDCLLVRLKRGYFFVDFGGADRKSVV